MDTYTYTHSQPQSPSHFQSLPLIMPLDHDSDMPLYFRDRLNHMSGYQDFDLFSAAAAYPDNHHHTNLQSVVMPIDTNFHKMQSTTTGGVSQSQVLTTSPTLPSTLSSPVTPTSSDSESQAESDATMQKHNVQSVKRRMQNRQAQRRFRERKEERQQSLEQKAVNLEKKHQELSEEFRLKCDEASNLLKEKECLKGEIEDLRKRWRLMVGLLQRPNGAQSLATLLAGDSLFQYSSSSTPSSCPSISSESAAPAPLDELLGCLHALVVPNKPAPHSS